MSEHEPMTPNQATLLARLCDQAGEPFNGSLTKAEANRQIRELKPAVPSRAEVRAVSCGTCGADAETSCVEPNGRVRGPHHRGRVDRVEWLGESERIAG